MHCPSFTIRGQCAGLTAGPKELRKPYLIPWKVLFSQGVEKLIERSFNIGAVSRHAQSKARNVGSVILTFDAFAGLINGAFPHTDRT